MNDENVKNLEIMDNIDRMIDVTERMMGLVEKDMGETLRTEDLLTGKEALWPVYEKLCQSYLRFQNEKLKYTPQGQMIQRLEMDDKDAQIVQRFLEHVRLVQTR